MYVVFFEIKFKSVTPYLVNKLVYMFGLLKISRKLVKIFKKAICFNVFLYPRILID